MNQNCAVFRFIQLNIQKTYSTRSALLNCTLVPYTICCTYHMQHNLFLIQPDFEVCCRADFSEVAIVS